MLVLARNAKETASATCSERTRSSSIDLELFVDRQIEGSEKIEIGKVAGNEEVVRMAVP